MSTTLNQLAGTNQSVLTTELNSLANNALVAGSAITLTSAGYVFGDVELVCTFGSAPTAGTGISLWFLRKPDGTNYEDGSSSITPARAPDCVLPVRAVTSAQRVTVPGVQLPVGVFEVLAKNDGTGQSLAASGNTVKILPTTYQNV